MEFGERWARFQAVKQQLTGSEFCIGRSIGDQVDMSCISKLHLHVGGGRIAFLLAISFAAIAGCADGGVPGLYPVSGRITYEGKPVSGATISFVGRGTERPATAISKADGNYDLYTLDSRGAQPGNYNVVVTKLETPPDSINQVAGFDTTGKDLSMEQSIANAGKPIHQAKQILPAKYGSQMTTTLIFEVKNSDKNVIDLNLE